MRFRTLRTLLVLTTISLLGSATGCASTRTVFVEQGTPIKMGPDVVGHVYYLDATTGEWTLSAEPVQIPEGWLCVSPED